MDIFEKLKSDLGCEYISDLKFEPNLSRAKKRVSCMNVDALSTAELKDLTEYLYGVSLADRGELLSTLKG